ncbi:MAG: FAD-binding oxidoreductase [Bacteroidales bacterium]|nr:FAD-binding oxidoreductase [Bacteroidales bacterium]MCF8391156.1 FAD-binding oxidoreductase [Bacteroidales bacterium]
MVENLRLSLQEINSILGKANVISDQLLRMALAPDAGCYIKTPEVVLKPTTESEVSQVLKVLSKYKVPVTFRAAGTSLSGQSISDSVLMVAAGDKWSKTEVIEQGKFIRTQPGITGGRINQILKPFGVKLGPDPASINSALIGGIISNNASGMSCGTHANSYATIKSARIVFADGYILDTSDEESRKKFTENKADLIEKINNIRLRIIQNPELLNLIIAKYSIKNTTGFSMNAFVDYSNPIDIILHLMVGSEGSLGFISEAVFETLPVLKKRASSLIYFASLKEACDAVPVLKKAGVSAIELLDREALRSIEDKPGIPGFIKQFPKTTSALLIDLEEKDELALDNLMSKTERSLKSFSLIRDFEVTKDTKQILEFWKIRKGVFPSVGGRRKPGTVVIIEDVAVKLEYLTEAVLSLRKLLDENGYGDAVIYGHALDGNLHFIFSQDFTKEDELKSYKNLIHKLTRLIVDKFHGSLKAEHGTGINMAPFVRYEWGDDIYSMMKEIKNEFDPHNLLNPGVIINEDEEAHLKNFKRIPEIHHSVDTCIECGFCEINCLSNAFTLSARQRIVVQRGLKLLKNENNPNNRLTIREIEESFEYQGNESCAGDGLCSTSCPLDIDTGNLIKHIRSEKILTSKSSQKWAARLANNFSKTTSILRFALLCVDFLHRLFGTGIFKALTSFVHFISFRKIPVWHKYMPKAAPKFNKPEHSDSDSELKVVYFPSCLNQTMGPARSGKVEKSLMDVTQDVLRKAGYEILFPENMNKLCCGTPWESKGHFEIANLKSSELEEELLKISDNGKIPVLCDTSPCIYRMRKVMDKKLKLYEPIEFAHDFLLDKLIFHKTNKKLAFHTTCTTTKMDLGDKFLKVASCCTENVVFPQEVGCCGFAGDKGFFQPELNDWSLRNLKPAVQNCEEGYSNSRTCEIGLSKTAGFDYKSIMYLISETSESK